MTPPELRDRDGKQVELVKVKGLRYRRGGKDAVESLQWYSNGKEWFVEKLKVVDYIK